MASGDGRNRRDELEKAGWYPVEHNRYKKGEAIAVLREAAERVARHIR